MNPVCRMIVFRNLTASSPASLRPLPSVTDPCALFTLLVFEPFREARLSTPHSQQVKIFVAILLGVQLDND